MPPLEAFPLAHQVTFKYYIGVILFLEENYVEVEQPRHFQSRRPADHSQSEKNLTEAWKLCHKDATRNREFVHYLPTSPESH